MKNVKVTDGNGPLFGKFRQENRKLSAHAVAEEGARTDDEHSRHDEEPAVVDPPHVSSVTH